jgi:germination protein M
MNQDNKEKKSLCSPVTIIFLVILAIIGIGFLVVYRQGLPGSGENQRSAGSSPGQDRVYLGGNLPANSRDMTHRQVTLLFLDEQKMELVPEERDIPRQMDGVTEIRQTLVELLLGSKTGNATVIPDGTRLREVWLDLYQTAYVDLTREIMEKHPGGVTEEILTVLSIVRTVRENFPQVSRVQLLIEGQEVPSLAGHVLISKPFTGNEFISRLPTPNQESGKGGL